MGQGRCTPREALFRRALIVALVLASMLTNVPMIVAPSSVSADISGYVLEDEIIGLTLPTAVRFAADGRIFVSEKSGLIKVFDDLDDSTATVVADLRAEVFDGYDRGLLDIELDPDFPVEPWIYALYTRDALPGGQAPYWNDDCPSPPGYTTDGCVVDGRLVRFSVSTANETGPPAP